MKTVKIVTTLYLLLSCLVGHAEEMEQAQNALQEMNPLPTISDEWRYTVGASIWAPASTTSSFLSNDMFVGSSQSSVTQNLQSTGSFAMVSGEAHKNNWGLMADLVYWQINDGTQNTKYVTKKTSLFSGQSANTTQTIMTAAATYTVYNTPSFYVDALAGARYVSSTTSATVNTVYKVISGKKTKTTISNINVSNVDTATDAILGIKGRYRIADSAWYIPFYFDAGSGAGSENNTWQALAGIGHAFSWGDVSLVYRAMYFELGGSDGLTKYSNYGPQLGASINF